MPTPVLLIVPRPEITLVKLAVPPDAAVNVALLLLVIRPEKVADPAVSIPSVPEPEAALRVPALNAILSKRLLPVAFVAPVRLRRTKAVLSPFSAVISVKDLEAKVVVKLPIVPAEFQVVPSVLYSQI